MRPCYETGVQQQKNRNTALFIHLIIVLFCYAIQKKNKEKHNRPKVVTELKSAHLNVMPPLSNIFWPSYAIVAFFSL